MIVSSWGWLIILYLFLAGAGSGAFCSALAAKVIAPGRVENFVKAGSLLSGPLVLVGTVCLVLDLEAGLREPWRMCYLVSNGTSMISWGVAILSFFIPVAFLHAAGVNRITGIGRAMANHIGLLERVGAPLALATAAYTGVLLAVSNGVPFWNTALMPILFLLSALSTGQATTVLASTLLKREPPHALSSFLVSHIALILAEAFVLILLILVSLTRSTEAAVSARMIMWGTLAPLFWAFVVTVGLLIPLVLHVVEYRQIGEIPTPLALATPAFVLVGGLSLRAVIVFAECAPQIIS